jgi:hypothetical protein
VAKPVSSAPVKPVEKSEPLPSVSSGGGLADLDLDNFDSKSFDDELFDSL